MNTNVFVIILLTSILHGIWNGLVKKHPNKVVAISAIVLGQTLGSIIAILLIFVGVVGLKLV